jgi:chromosome segregation ATPase
METQRPIFELARFAWGAPDRLELSGTFVGVPDVPADAPTLVISGADGVHRLPVVPESLSGPPEDGRRWEAVFAWQEPPVAFEVAELQFGDDMVIELPEPDGRRTRSHRKTLSVTKERARSRSRRKTLSPASEPERHDHGPEADVAIEGDGVQLLHVQAELLGAQEALRDAKAALERTQEELRRVQHDLATERELRNNDAERFHHALATMSETAEQAMTAEQRAAHQLGAEARTMLEEQAAALKRLEAEAATHAAAESEARAEIDGLRARVADLEPAVEEAEELRAALKRLEAEAATHATAESDARAEIDGLRARVADLEPAAGETEELRAALQTATTQAGEARSVMAEARSEAERLLATLNGTRGPGGDGA